MSTRLRRTVTLFSLFFGNSAHELAPRVYLKELWPFQRRAFVNLLKGFCHLDSLFRGQAFCFFVAASHIDNSKSVFETFAVMRQFVVWQKKCLLGELRWVRGHRILAEECSVARRGRPAKVPA